MHRFIRSGVVISSLVALATGMMLVAPAAQAATRQASSRRAPARVVHVRPAGRPAAPSIKAPPTCTDNWKNAVSGNFNTAADWSTGVVPGSSDVACIQVAGTYTVTMTQSNTLTGLVVSNGAAGTQTLSLLGNASAAVDLALNGPSNIGTTGQIVMDSNNSNGGYSMISGSGSLTNDGLIETVQDAAGSLRYLRINITNDNDGTLTIGAPNTLEDSGNTITNNGTFQVASTGSLTISGSSFVTQSGGSLTDLGSFTFTGGTLTASGGTSGAGSLPIVMQSSTLADSGWAGTSAAPASLLLQCSNTTSGSIPKFQTVNVQGNGCGNSTATLSGNMTNHGTLELDSTNSGGFAMLTGSTGTTLTNDGTLTTVNDAGYLRYIRVDLTNGSTGKITIGADTLQDSTTTTVNDGKITVSATGSLNLTGSSVFTEDGKGLANSGSVYLNGATFNQTKGNVTGSKPVVLQASTLNDTLGKGSFVLQCSNTLAGTIPSGQTVNTEGNACGNAQTTLSGAAVINNGTFELDSTSSGAFSMVTGSPLTNNGTFSTVQGLGNTRYIRVPVTNNSGATMSIGAADSRQDSSTLTTNSGTFTVAAGAELAVSGSSTLTQSGGTLTNSGTLFLNGGTFNQNGGALSGNAIILQASTLNDSASTGTMTFLAQCSNTLNGTVPSGQTVLVQGNACGSASLALSGASVTNHGTIELDSISSGAFALISGSPLTNSGTFSTVQDFGNTRYIRVPITNNAAGTISIGAADTRQDSNTLTTNNGTVSIADGADLEVSGSSTFTNGASARLNVTVDVSAGSGFGIVSSGGTVNNAGTLGVTTVGTPAHGAQYTVVSDTTVNGTFSSLSSSVAYTVSYPAGKVVLTAP